MEASSQSPLKNYDADWKRVDALIKKGLPASALTEVKKIYKKSKEEKQDAQLIKALVFMTNLQMENRENNPALSITEIEKEASAAKEPAKSILNSIAAGMYWSFFQMNRWKFYQRTNTTGFKKDDIATWTVADLHQKIAELFLSSLQDEGMLKKTATPLFSPIIIKGNTPTLRPTLFDLLAHRALDYFKNDERDIQRPAYAFEISQEAAFAPAAKFIRQKFDTKDSSSLHHKAILLLQQLLSFHLEDKNEAALIDADIERLEFVHQFSVHPAKDKLFVDGLKELTGIHSGHPMADQAWYLLAAAADNRGLGYHAFGDTTLRYERLEAKKICEKVIQRKENTEGKVNCYNLLLTIKQQELEFKVEKVNLPDQPFRASVSYRNINRLFFRVIRSSTKLKQEMQNPYDQKYWNEVLGSASSVQNWDQEFPASEDLQSHRAEIKVNGLAAGEYVLIASTQKEFNPAIALLGARYFYVSTISYVNNGQDYFVLNRDNGRPIEKASVQKWERKYDQKTGDYLSVKAASYTTDGNGFFSMKTNKPDNDRNNFTLDIASKGEHLFLDELLYQYYYPSRASDNPQEIRSVWLFTDRGIYRPGQTLFFKGIVSGKTAGEKAALKIRYQSKIILRDVNNQQIDSLEIATNEYGSFSGKFALPQNALNGSFSLSLSNAGGQTTFQVEEYKRPKFFVDYEKIKGRYRLNDSIKITGLAKAYAGNNIDNAKVSFRVVRVARFYYPWLFHRGWQPPVQSLEIAHGISATDKDGKFEIVFSAIPDLSIDRNTNPVFDYTVYADITDINGETRSGEKTVSVGYQSLLLHVDLPLALAADSLQSVAIRTENMNGAFEPAKVQLTIIKLDEEKRLIRQRYWERPDQFVMTKAAFLNSFPFDEYDNETDMASWLKKEIVLDKTDSTKNGGGFSLAGKSLKPGYYLVQVLSTDRDGLAIKDQQYIELTDPDTNKIGRPQYLITEGGHHIEPGEKTSVSIGSSADNVFVIQQTYRHDTETKRTEEEPAARTSFFTLNQERKNVQFTATETDRGGFGIVYLFVKHNRFYVSNQQVVVPWTNKELKIEYASYRDKTLPGSEEKWKIKMTGYKKEKIASEMLVSMYDASLDQFFPFAWAVPNIWPYYYNNARWVGDQNFAFFESVQKSDVKEETKEFDKRYDYLKVSDNYYQQGELFARSGEVKRGNSSMQPMAMGVPGSQKDISLRLEADTLPVYNLNDPTKIEKYVITESVAADKPNTKKVSQDMSTVQVRKTFNETAFFFPDLRTDSSGAIEFSFTMPEALTKWKLQALAHTKDLAFGLSTKEIITQKELMVQPNAPRFLREGDRMEFSTKIVNLTDKEITGQVELQLYDAATNQSVDGWFQNMYPNQYFTVGAGSSEVSLFPVQVPYLFNKALGWRIIAKAKGVSDGEESALPVLSNKILVTETIPLNLRAEPSKKFNFEKLSHSAESETLEQNGVTVEYTSNPSWYALQALPYLMEYPYECAEQTWNRYYANALATTIANSAPRIRNIFEKWKTTDTSALLSNLQKNEELKSVLLQETPWVLQAKSEAQQKKNLGLLFDAVRMSRELGSSLDKLKQLQNDNGGFVWFKGGPDDRYITQYIVTGIGHLKKLKGIAADQAVKIRQLMDKALPYLDRKLKQDYDNLVKHKTDLKKYVPDNAGIQYLYMRSFFPEYPLPAATKTAYAYYYAQLQKNWISQSKYMQGMIALVLFRSGDLQTAAAILKSLKETSIRNEELGMYWKNQRNGWYWYEAPLETQALLIEAFAEIGQDPKTVDDLKTWLLKNKQTNSWSTTKATAEACYALLLQGSNWMNEEPAISIRLGNTVIHSTEAATDAGSGYFKAIIPAEKVNPEMGAITVTEDRGASLPAPAARTSSWGAVYWQYFENLDKITTSATPLKLNKKLFVETNTDRGPVLTPVNEGETVKVGDKIKVRIELRVDRDMEYVHMKDMRASSLEPVNVLSGYKWQGGLGYYETTKDASTNFFFGSLGKGTYVFEYSLFANQKGNFSNGITTIQCMYAPEFTSHSEGIRLNVE